MNKNLNLYSIFYEVAKYNSISAAAKSMYLSQPAISKSIKNLENILNERLFYRTLNGIVLTEKGKSLYLYLEKSFSYLILAEKMISEEKNMTKGKLTIGIRSHVASFYLMEKISDYHNKYPKIEISIISRPSQELMKLLNSNELDFVIDISSYKDNFDDYDVKNLKKLNHCFVTKMDSTFLKDKKKYKLVDLENIPLILPVEHSSHRKVLNQFAFDNGMKFKNVLSVETSELIYNFVMNGEGVGYIIEDMVKNDIDNGVLRKIILNEKLPSVDLKLICIKRNLTEASCKFINDYLN